MSALLPVHGFVLAGGKSSRMGTDKALLRIGGRPMVEIAVEKLRSFCAAVSIAGNRDDLASFAPVVHERRLDAGPAAGIEAGLAACEQPWAMFVPVDVPLVPGELLRRWAEEVEQAGDQGLVVSHLCSADDQPTFCMLRRELAGRFGEVLDGGERKLTRIFQQMEAGGGFQRTHDVSELCGRADPLPAQAIEGWFMNVNTPAELADAEMIAKQKRS